MACRRGLLLFAFSIALASSSGCALTLDYDPPTSDGGVGMDGARADVGPVSCTSDPGCDDALACTIDACANGVCQHTSTCPAGTDCVERSGGVCRRACAGDGDCDDGIACTDDSCNLADGHCEHASTCDASKPRCLGTGACVPTSCDADVDCDDEDACNGHERCIGGACEGGTPVTCDPTPTGDCAPLACDPRVGTCVPTPDAGLCDDHVGCTADACVDSDGQWTCRNAPDDRQCDDGSSCTTDVCDSNAGCSNTPVPCDATAPCITSAACDESTGACTYAFSCPAGQVCTGSGCQGIPCASTDECASIPDPTGCGFTCQGTRCAPQVLCAPTTGECGVVDAACAADNTACHYHADAGACDDLDPATNDACDPGSFACVHTCIDRPNDCVTMGYDDVTHRCVPSLDDTFCAAHHAGTGIGDCTRWLCTGAAAAADGCARVPVSASCEDGYRCTDDVCMLQGDGSGRCQRMARDANCNDGATCTDDRCDPGNANDATGCTYQAHDEVCTDGLPPLQCAEVFCVGGSAPGPVIAGTGLPAGCALRFRTCEMAGVPGGYCNPLTGLCETGRNCATGGSCDDGIVCNGLETCVGTRCIPGPPPECGLDPLGCALVCDEGTGRCQLPGGPGTCVGF